MGLIPEAEKVTADLLAFLGDACSTYVDVPQPDGSVIQERRTNEEKVWWKTHIINANTFSRFAFVLKELEGLAYQCYHNMGKERADVLSQQILATVENYKYAIDAKSSESLTDKNNARATLIDKIKSIKVERMVNLNEEAKKSLFAGFAGGKDEDQQS